MISVLMQLQSSYRHEDTGLLSSAHATRSRPTRYALSPDTLRDEDAALRSAIARAPSLNVLVQCVDVAANSTFDVLAELFLRRPHVRVLPGPLNLPDDADGRPLIIGDVSLMTLQQQIALYDWQDEHDSTQIISLTSRSLWPLVTSGRFLDGLFYRLNVMSVQALASV
jgi:hypothetical protein